jgi:phage baseplate assembly protein V
MISAGKHLGLVIGVVSQRDDDGKLGRVKVKFPTLGGRESDWIFVLTHSGGANGGAHGHVSIPEKEESVVVAYINGDPKQPVILGSIYSEKQPPPWTEIDERGFRTPKGHSIKISDKDDWIEIETQGGQSIKIDDPGKSITVKGTQQITVDAPQQITIKAQNVRVEATTSTIKADSVSIQATTSTIKADSVDIKATSAVIEASSISLGGQGATEAAILGTSFAVEWSAHVHPNGNMGSPTGPPVKPLTSLSKITKLSG